MDNCTGITLQTMSQATFLPASFIGSLELTNQVSWLTLCPANVKQVAWFPQILIDLQGSCMLKQCRIVPYKNLVATPNRSLTMVDRGEELVDPAAKWLATGLAKVCCNKLGTERSTRSSSHARRQWGPGWHQHCSAVTATTTAAKALSKTTKDGRLAVGE